MMSKHVEASTTKLVALQFQCVCKGSGDLVNMNFLQNENLKCVNICYYMLL